MRRTVFVWLPALLLLAVAPAGAVVVVDPLISVTLAPRAGGPHTRLAVSFTNPGQTGRSGLLDRSETLSVRGPARVGCRSGWAKQLPAAKTGAKVRALLSPGRDRWCTGRFAGQIVEYQRVVCGPAQLCPEFEIAPRQIARFAFSVRRSATSSPH